ncbi:FAD-binding oxidoreductase [Candidatus Daviesbacteria bacterium]|nr:FAD-binding oxidoreductase [Candidatus Daviesbacteria bacterium]
MSLKDDLHKIVEGEVFDDSETLTIYSKDASFFQIQPQAVIYPENAEDIKKLVKFATDNPGEHLSLTIRSGGTDMSGAAISDSLILDMTKHFNKILKIEPDSATVEPGVFYRDFEPETLKKDLLLPTYPASKEICTLGGMVNNNSAGEKTLIFGQTEKFVQSLKVILSDGNEYTFEPLNKEELNKKIAQKNFEGEIYRDVYKLVTQHQELIQTAEPKVSKNAAGYLLWKIWDGQTFNLSKLICGAQGTLGIVTEIKFRLIQPKKHTKLLVIFLYNISHLGEIVEEVLKFAPESFESYDDQTFRFAVKFWAELLNVIHPKNLLTLAWNFIPEAYMTLQHGFPKLILLAEFTGDSEEEVAEKCLAAQKAIKHFHVKSRITRDEDDEKKYLTVRRESFNLFRHHAGSKRTAPFIDDIIVQPRFLPEFLPKLQHILKPYKKFMTYTIAGHIGNGNFHIIPLVDMKDPRVIQAIPELAQKVYTLVFEYKGSMTAEHNDGLVRGSYLEKMYGKKVYELFKEVKKIFDPNDIFNPHKKVDATLEYSLNHLVKS